MNGMPPAIQAPGPGTPNSLVHRMIPSPMNQQDGQPSNPQAQWQGQNPPSQNGGPQNGNVSVVTTAVWQQNRAQIGHMGKPEYGHPEYGKAGLHGRPNGYNSPPSSTPNGMAAAAMVAAAATATATATATAVMGVHDQGQQPQPQPPPGQPINMNINVNANSQLHGPHHQQMSAYGHSNAMLPNQRPVHQMAPMSSAGVGGPMVNGMMRNRQAPYPTPQQYMMQKRGQNPYPGNMPAAYTQQPYSKYGGAPAQQPLPGSSPVYNRPYPNPNPMYHQRNYNGHYPPGGPGGGGGGGYYHNIPGPAPPGVPTPPVTPSTPSAVPCPGPGPYNQDVKPHIKQEMVQEELRLTFPVRDGVVLPPFRLEHNLAVSNHVFHLRESVYNTLMWRPDLELQLKCFHHEDRAMNTNWPASVAVSVNATPLHIQRSSDVKSSTHKPLYLKNVCCPNRNTIQITVTACCCSHLFVLQLVHRPSVRSVLQGLLRKRMLPIENCVQKVKKWFGNGQGSMGEEGVEQTATRVSLKCPVTYRKIQLPARGHDCRHIQCFDLETYLQMNCERPTWKCPVCNKNAQLEGLEIDQYMWSILQQLAKNDFDEVTIEANANWKPVIQVKMESASDCGRWMKSNSPGSMKSPNMAQWENQPQSPAFSQVPASGPATPGQPLTPATTPQGQQQPPTPGTVGSPATPGTNTNPAFPPVGTPDFLAPLSHRSEAGPPAESPAPPTPSEQQSQQQNNNIDSNLDNISPDENIENIFGETELTDPNELLKYLG
ncbi:DgyrCDS12827 [Dimorphilus gyrociliatus]|uniref:DgyrCDS12827 n=2 Tax=Dimorphilus gyrociliatus TaxID=2664684 RepID=A0A7I8W8V0_9ANNE|nr:DgyrCDS12827 [Dimorphilus gyrociliatus]